MDNPEPNQSTKIWTREEVIAHFRPKPLQTNFQTMEEWEEAMGRWNSTVGRAIARQLKAFNLPLSPDSVPNIDASLANSEKNEVVPAEQTPLKQMEMNSQEYHDHVRPLIAEAHLASAQYRAQRKKAKQTGSAPQIISSDED